MEKKTKALFLCTGNSARSQMAEALANEHGGELLDAYSAGLEPREIHPYTIQVLKEVGTDIGEQHSKPVSQFLGRQHFGYLVTVCAEAEAKCPVFPGVSRREYWPFEDPVAFQGTEEARLAKFREVRDQVEQRVKGWIADLSTTDDQRDMRGGTDT